MYRAENLRNSLSASEQFPNWILADIKMQISGRRTTFTNKSNALSPQAKGTLRLFRMNPTSRECLPAIKSSLNRLLIRWSILSFDLPKLNKLPKKIRKFRFFSIFGNFPKQEDKISISYSAQKLDDFFPSKTWQVRLFLCEFLFMI